jgi:hypothetical protein
MKESQEYRNTTETSQDQPRTSRRHSPRLPATATKSAKRNRSPEPTPRSSRKRTSLPRAQSTLTQIDFVTQPTAPGDERLDYVDEHQRPENPRTELSKINDGSDKDSDYLPAPPVRSARITKFKINEREHEPSKRPQNRRNSGFGDREADRGLRPRKSETPKTTIRTKGGRKSLEKSTGKRNKTLTQMDFVRRYITIDDDDDDLNMGYIQPTLHKKDIRSEQKTPMPESNKIQPAKILSPAKRNRVFEEELDLSTGDPIPQPNAIQEREHGNENECQRVSAVPVTPQKSRMREIPSSQTPESPGLAIITSSQFRSATRSPSKKNLSNPTDQPIPPIKEESPETRTVVEDSQDLMNESLRRTTTLDSQSTHNYLNMSQPNNNEDFPSSAPPVESDIQEIPTEENEKPRTGATKREKTVIYETDADSDYDDSEDSPNRDSVKLSTKKTPQANCHQASSQATQHSLESFKSDSPELPLPDVQSSPNLDDAPPFETLMSDASICYQRMQAATQFPHEPIPTLNTQKMAELFPHEGGTQISKVGTGPLNHSRSQVPGPFSRTQTQSQGDKEPTEMVPESSPIREREQREDDHATFQRPRAPKSVVQVESSQAVDRDPHWQGQALSRSQLLTSSVMESIPMPNFWMGSQDSVGEPYSLPEG